MSDRMTLSSYLAKKPGTRTGWRMLTIPLRLLAYPFFKSGGVIRMAIDNGPSATANRLMYAQTGEAPRAQPRNYAARRRAK